MILEKKKESRVNSESPLDIVLTERKLQPNSNSGKRMVWTLGRIGDSAPAQEVAKKRLEETGKIGSSKTKTKKK